MDNYINGIIGEGRKLTFENPKAYSGESNSAELKIALGEWASQEVDGFALCFETSPLRENFIIHSAAAEGEPALRVEEGFIFCPLTDEMTETGVLKIQVIAYKTDENGTEIVEKSGVARLQFGHSLCGPFVSHTEKNILLNELMRLALRVKSLESRAENGMIFDDDSPVINENGKARLNTAAFDFDYFCAALGARLLFVDSESTPLYFPETVERAEEILTAASESFDPSEMTCEMVVVPGNEDACACLALIYDDSGRTTVGRFSGADLLELLRNGVN